MSKALDDFAKAFGAAAQIPGNVNEATHEVREAVQEVKTGVTIFAVATLVFQGILAYAALRNLALAERRVKK